MSEILRTNEIMGFYNITVFSAATDNEEVAALSVEILTNNVGSIRFLVHTMGQCAKEVSSPGTSWIYYKEMINAVASYFNQHQKSA